jgi:hypothetical protein
MGPAEIGSRLDQRQPLREKKHRTATAEPHDQRESPKEEMQMFNTRSLSVSILGAVLWAASLIGAQDVKPPERAGIARPRSVIQQLALRPPSLLAFSLPANPVSAPLIGTPDLSRYREFQFGMNLLAVAKQADVKPSEARVIHQRPAVIQELEWRPSRSIGSSPQGDPVKEVLFSFYNGELFRMVVNYDQQKTEGLTNEDMVEAISTKYGTATRPDAKIILFSSFQVYNDSEKVIARWEDSQYSFNLFRSSYQPTFGILVLSKRLDALAGAAIVEAIRLDEQEAPEREIERQKKQAEQDHDAQEQARLVNKPSFRP